MQTLHNDIIIQIYALTKAGDDIMHNKLHNFLFMSATQMVSDMGCCKSLILWVGDLNKPLLPEV